MKCLLCDFEIKLGPDDKVPAECPKCRASAGYQLYAYSQTNEKQDINHASEEIKQAARDAGRLTRRKYYYTGGMCFANTLQWMAFRVLHGTKDLDVFQREYVACKKKQAALYQKFIQLMNAQSDYQDNFFGSFNHYVNYTVSGGRDPAALGPLKSRLPFMLECSCGVKSAPSVPAPDTMINRTCASCSKLGNVRASLMCPGCLMKTVTFEAPGTKQCSCGYTLAIAPIALCRDQRGQANHRVAHQEKRAVYRKLARVEGLDLVEYKHGFCFGSNTGLLVDFMFAEASKHPTGLLGVLGFEGDNGHAHVTSYGIRKGWIGFFDPNLGEYLFPDRIALANYLHWHLNHNHWPGDAINYQDMHDGWYVGNFVRAA